MLPGVFNLVRFNVCEGLSSVDAACVQFVMLWSTVICEFDGHVLPGTNMRPGGTFGCIPPGPLCRMLWCF